MSYIIVTDEDGSLKWRDCNAILIDRLISSHLKEPSSLSFLLPETRASYLMVFLDISSQNSGTLRNSIELVEKFYAESQICLICAVPPSINQTATVWSEDMVVEYINKLEGKEALVGENFNYYFC